jgi:hypothetical protein
MITWEYQYYKIKNNFTFIKELNEQGAQGWELIEFDHSTNYGLMKRPTNVS